MFSSSGVKLQWDADRKEPFVVIPGQHDFRLTPLRHGDEDGVVRLCSEPSIGYWTFRRPFPYARSDAEWWINHLVPRYTTYLPQVGRALEENTPPPPHDLSLILRYMPDGSQPADTTAQLAQLGLEADEVLGSMHSWPAAEEGTSEADMLALPPHEQVWEVGYDLLPALQGRGLGKGMIVAALEGWIRASGIGKVIAVENAASCAVLARCGFKETSRSSRQWPEAKGGGERMLIRWERILDL